MIAGRVSVDPVGAGAAAISVCGATNLGGAGNDRVAEWFVFPVGIGDRIGFAECVRVLTVGKDCAVSRVCVDTRIFIIALAFMACDARISCKIGFACTGGVKGDCLPGGDGCSDACNSGTGGCNRLGRDRGIGADGVFCFMVCGCRGVVGLCAG